MIKDYMRIRYQINILKNITEFPIHMDKTFSKYYEEIAGKIKNIPIRTKERVNGDKYYIQKIKTFFVEGKIYYEVTLSTATDHNNKFDRIIAFTRLNLMANYAVKLSTVETKINIFGKPTTIKIIDNWSVAIRACEIKNFYRILGITKQNYTASDNEYYEIMNLMTQENYNLLELVDLSDPVYNHKKEKIKSNCKSSHIWDMLDIARDYIKNDKNGGIILRYLLYHLNNKVIKSQYSMSPCSKLSDLHLRWETIPFEEMPYASSLRNHNPKKFDLFEIIPAIGREDELLASYIRSNIETKNKLYTSLEELKAFGEVEQLVQKFNSKLYDKHIPYRCLQIENNHIYIYGYEKDTIDIINELNELAKVGIQGYHDSFASFLKKENYQIDSQEKRTILENLYEDSCVALVYGAAGTGKSTLIKYLAYFYRDNPKVCLANTNSAVENLKRKVKDENCEFMTVHRYLNTLDTECDILVMDECSTVSNVDMKKILEKKNFKILLLTGDTYQIESISYGNWFSLAKTLVAQEAVYELNCTWRSDKQELLDLWSLVRESDDRIDEMLTKKEISKPIDESILIREEKDEVILCLNYDGLYGINNINNYLQNANRNRGIVFGLNTYKIGDPIIFGDTNRFLPVIYNNLKGVIYDIEEEKDRVWFSIQIDKAISQLDVQFAELELLKTLPNEKSIVKFYVNRFKNVDEDDDINSKAVVPFSIAYAVSIHKSQGLEYDCVKVIITNEIDDLITHNIFYTAITRAKQKLKIYWTPECQNKIISAIKHRENNKDAIFIKKKLNIHKTIVK